MKKRMKHTLVVMMVLAVMLNTVVFALEDASAYIAGKGGGITALGGGNMRITFDVTATGMMDTLGASSIHIHRDSDDELMGTIRYTDPGFSNMMTTNNYSYVSSVNWQGVSGETYYAVITFYAQNDTGDDYRGFATTSVRV